MTTNSSPPRRASRSELAQRSLEPLAELVQEIVADRWPKESLTSLKRFRSTNRKASWRRSPVFCVLLLERIQQLEERAAVGERRQLVGHRLPVLVGREPLQAHDRERGAHECRRASVASASAGRRADVLDRAHEQHRQLPRSRQSRKHEARPGCPRCDLQDGRGLTHTRRETSRIEVGQAIASATAPRCVAPSPEANRLAVSPSVLSPRPTASSIHGSRRRPGDHGGAGDHQRQQQQVADRVTPGSWRPQPSRAARGVQDAVEQEHGEKRRGTEARDEAVEPRLALVNSPELKLQEQHHADVGERVEAEVDDVRQQRQPTSFRFRRSRPRSRPATTRAALRRAPAARSARRAARSLPTNARAMQSTLPTQLESRPRPRSPRSASCRTLWRTITETT